MLGACSDPPREPTRAEPVPASFVVPPSTPPVADLGSDGELVIDDDPVPSEPSVTLDEPGEGSPQPLAKRKPGTSRRVVVQVRLTTGHKKKLYLPVVRLAGDVVLDEIGDEGSGYRWTPRVSTVLTSGDGADPEFIAGLRAALAPAEPPTPVALALDRWDVATTFGWPADVTDPHVAEIAAAQRLALGHLTIPVPELSMSEGTVWTVNRKVDLFGIPAWQSLRCTVDRVHGDQMELSANVHYFGIEGAPIAGKPLGLDSVAELRGQGKLKARFDLATALPVDAQLRGVLKIRTTEGGKRRRFGFEVRADEEYRATEDPRVTLEGPLVQGALVRGTVAAGTAVRFNNRKVKVSPEGDFIIGFGRDAGPRALLSFAFDGQAPERHILHVADRTFEPEAIDGLPPEMVDLDPKTRRALGKSRRRIKKLRGKSSDTPYFRDGFRWPMKGKITSTYGRKRILNGKEQGFHWGVDLAGPVGRKVRAPAGGVVIFAEGDVPLSGNLVIIDHGHGLTSSFLHLDKIRVEVGDTLAAGDVFATSGNTGRSTGPHLDWRMNLFDTRVDPQTIVSGKP